MLKRLATAGALTTVVGGMLVSAAPAMADNGAYSLDQHGSRQGASENRCTNYGENRTLVRSLEILEFHNVVFGGDGRQVGVTTNTCVQS
ncbi:hypothetical protein SAMN04489712_11558 [Thermomonospora echinospora]|uniref:Secreted protein n=1 Tax=Thermomonospora echinospora TaxID=1992 RepID=A0A1H6DBJ5_9ACTN|nr:hypothetical protein [Thermomonospora echinospora]SEG82658.1 hypothetical protein SAMN04489712_11558 [Thermomonospora echinospora]